MRLQPRLSVRAFPRIVASRLMPMRQPSLPGASRNLFGRNGLRSFGQAAGSLAPSSGAYVTRLSADLTPYCRTPWQPSRSGKDLARQQPIRRLLPWRWACNQLSFGATLTLPLGFRYIMNEQIVFGDMDRDAPR